MIPDFSVVIVSYNVSPYLKLCLKSILRATRNSSVEIFVVDNASDDDSAEMVRKQFPQVNLIENSENIGFSKANNQALRKARGRYLLMLNPDTIVPETLFDTCIRILNDHPEVGGAGIKMLDGQGNFLPESKRGLPTPLVSFFKISGIYRLFPRSSFINKYYLGNTSACHNQYVDILAGAFLLVRREVAESIGYMPEEYFMYGEDIDFSYQIVQKGYKNYYIAEEKIIHFKGESTKKGSLNYVYIFYKAMAIFSAKYFGRGNAFFYNIIISAGIALTAIGAAFKRIVQTIGIPVIELIAFYAGYWYIHDYWEKNHRFISGGEYPVEYVYGILPMYSIILVLSIYASGGYRKTQKLTHSLRGLGLGFLLISVIYGLSPEQWRFSRAIMVLGVISSMVWIVIYRYILKTLRLIQPSVSWHDRSAWVVTNSDASPEFDKAGWTSFFLKKEHLDASIHNFRITLMSFKPDYLIFDSDSLSFSNIIRIIETLQLDKTNILYKIPSENIFIGSNSIIDLSHKSNDFKSVKVPFQKKFNDALLSAFYIKLFLPHLHKKTNINISLIIKILSGKCSLIGYSSIKNSLIDLSEYIPNFSEDKKQKIAYEYYSKYSLKGDLQILHSIHEQLMDEEL